MKSINRRDSKVTTNGQYFLPKVFLAIILLFGGVAHPEVLSPPSEPEVPPIIATAYSNDLNRNKIDDELESRAETALSQLRVAVTPKEEIEAQALLESTVEVELIFSRQISQRQIDAFLGRGGQVTYIYKAVSYGWNGRIALGEVDALSSLMGAELVLVQEAKPITLHLDVATRTGRVRPVWASGFAGNPSGFDGSSTITIAIVDTGIDATHSDLSGRQVYWHDFSSDGNGSPVDIVQHGSHVAGIALGTGAASGSGTGTLYYTDVGDLTGVASGSFYLFPIGLPAASVTYSSTARWIGGGSTSLGQVYHTKGTSGGWTYISSPTTGTSPQTETNTFTGSSSLAYSTALLSNGAMGSFAIANSVTNYPGVGDGFNKLRGVAPGCNWAAAKVFTNSDTGYSTWISAAIDDLVATRVTNNIKVINISIGINGNPGIDTGLRAKVNTTVSNGIVVVISAGNDGGASQVDDPGRAAMALTVAASDDNDQLTDYTSEGFSSPGSDEDYKPDIMAPGGSANYYTAILSVDSGSGDGSFADQQANDYASMQGTSMASPFAAGAAALVIDAMQQQGITWDFGSSQHARYVKMLLCVTASETNTNRENGSYNPTLQRSSGGPSGFPAGKDQYEGYGILNPDAAVEAVTLSYTPGSSASDTLGPGVYDRRVWARRVELKQGVAFEPNLTVPAGGDFDLYLYNTTPSSYGTPVILALSTQAGNGVNESFNYDPASDVNALLVVKRVSGSGTFSLTSQSPVDVDIIGSWVTGTTHATESGTNRVLAFLAHAKPSSGVTLTGVSYGGQSMTKVIDESGGSGSTRAYVAAFILNEAGIAAASGNTFSLTWSGTAPTSVAYSSVFLQDVNQTTLTGASASSTTSGTNITTSALATNNGDIVIDAAACSTTGNYTVNNGFTEALELTISGADGVDGYKSATGVSEAPSVTHDTSGRQSLIGFVVKVVSPPAPPGQASRPNPADGVTNISLAPTISWTAGAGATSHNVYFGTTSPGTFQGNQTGTTFAPGTLLPNTTYYWRIDETNAGGTTTGLIWSFTVIPAFTITASADANGTISPFGTIIKNYGESQLFTATSNIGYAVDKWLVDGSEVQIGGTAYTLSNITADHAVYVTFKELIFVISGYAFEQDGNTPVEGVPIQTDGNDVNAVTDANGFYKLRVDYNWSGIVTPQKEGYVFEPNSDTYANVITDYSDQNYVATLKTFVISGYVFDKDYVTPINDVNVFAENGGGPWTNRYGGGSDVTDANGYYEVVVDYNWSGKVVPAKYAYAFEPNKMEYVNVKSDSNAQDYTGTLLTFIIAGHIKNSCDVPIAGVLVDANNGGGEGTTDVNGFYEVWVDYNWYGTVTPTKGHHTFNPGEMVYVNVLADQTEQNYQATNIYDLDCDGSIGFGDLRIISENWLDGPDLPGDFHKDENDIVNFLDFAEFAKHWLEGADN